jgi:predicted acylesterase/phospholipase RssA
MKTMNAPRRRFLGFAAPKRLPAVPAALAEQASVPGIPDARLWPDRDRAAVVRRVLRYVQLEIAALERMGLPTGSLPPADFLAISGGGDHGAFAAGVLVGWTERGDRPQFNLVTGISVGALTAPFAFLGSAYDPVLRHLATSIGPRDVLRPRTKLGALLSDGLASHDPLARLVAKYVTPELLREIAREQEKGRDLHIATTNLDAARQVIWDMGAIAASGAPGALELFRKVMLASAAIPGVFSPVMIDVDLGDERLQEMHVDGGVISQLLVYPPLILAELEKLLGPQARRHVRGHVIRNGRLEPQWAQAERRTLSIGLRAMKTLIQTQGINDLYRLCQLAGQDDVDLQVAYIGSDFAEPHPQTYDPKYMSALFAYGHRLGSTGQAWHRSLFEESFRAGTRTTG